MYLFENILIGLNEAINRRNMELLEKAVASAEESEYKDKLQHKIEQAKDLMEHLKLLKGFAHGILELKQTTISEVHHYKEPKPPIMQDVMKATYLLMGETDEAVKVRALVDFLFILIYYTPGPNAHSSCKQT